MACGAEDPSRCARRIIGLGNVAVLKCRGSLFFFSFSPALSFAAVNPATVYCYRIPCESHGLILRPTTDLVPRTERSSM